MKKFIIKIIIVLAIGLLLGEIIMRLFPHETDVQNSYIAKNNLIAYYPNQTGGFDDNSHQWKINKYGNFGPEPKSLDSLILLLGDSFISNIMNPPECHQAIYLEKGVKKYNFFSKSREGSTFMELLEMSKSLEYLKANYKILYVHDGDFTESIIEINEKKLAVQISLKTKKIKYAELPPKRKKKFIHNFKFPYYLYSTYFANRKSAEHSGKKKNENYIDKIKELLIYAKHHYDCGNMILVFRPNSDPKVVALAKSQGFKCIFLKTKDYKSWQLPTDKHWSCYGHQQAAKQVSDYLNGLN